MPLLGFPAVAILVFAKGLHSIQPQQSNSITSTALGNAAFQQKPMHCCETQRMPSRTGCHTCDCSKCSCNWTALADTASIYIGLSNGCERNDHFHLCGNLCAPRRNVWIVSVRGLNTVGVQLKAFLYFGSLARSVSLPTRNLNRCCQASHHDTRVHPRQNQVGIGACLEYVYMYDNQWIEKGMCIFIRFYKYMCMWCTLVWFMDHMRLKVICLECFSHYLLICIYCFFIHLVIYFSIF